MAVANKPIIYSLVEVAVYACLSAPELYIASYSGMRK